MSMAILQGFRLPVPMPKAWLARRDVAASEAPKEEKRSP